MNQSSVFQPPDRQRVDERIATTIADAILDGVFRRARPCRPSETWQSGSVSTAPRYARVWRDCNRWA